MSADLKTFVFFREGMFYPVTIPEDQIIANVVLNPGTLRVEDVFGNTIWKQETENKPSWESLDSAASEVVLTWATLLHEVVDKGLIYWEPNTSRGHVAKADMLRRCEEFLKPYRAILSDPQS